MTWVCDKCFSKMEISYEAPNKYLVHCPNCGLDYYVDENDQLIDEDDD